jgi:FSR family fosmidomycin resistance protein-like MFS transporter
MSTVTTEFDSKKIERQNRWNFLSLSFLHFYNDVHSNVLPTVIPMLVQSIALTLGQAGLLNALFGVTHIIGQPIFGYLADKQRRPWNSTMGPVLCALGACMLPLSPNYYFAVLFGMMLSVGTAMFHPQGLGLCGKAGGEKNLAFYLSIFSSAGTFGSAVGPIYIVYMVSLLGRKTLPVMAIPVALVCFYVFTHYTPDSVEEHEKEHAGREQGNFFSDVRAILGKIGGIVAIATFRDATTQGIKLFLPSFIILRGGSVARGGFSLFAVTLAATVAGIIGGKLADMIGYKKVLIGALSLSPVFLIFGLHTYGALSLGLLMFGFALMQASNPVTTAMSQQLCPGARSTASSLSMGISWGLANFFTYPVGHFADVFGLEQTLYTVAFIPWIVTAWTLAYPMIRGKKQG